MTKKNNYAGGLSNYIVLKEVKDLIIYCVENKKPIVALCISPTLIAKSLQGKSYIPKLTLGSVKENSEYNIEEMHAAISSIGASTSNISIKEICVDEDLKIISAPCYMMNGNINDVYNNIKMAIDKLANIL